jgi:hypothetical protein
MRYGCSAIVITALAMFWLGNVAPANADTVDQVTVDTSAANAGGAGQAELIFSLLDGNGTGDGNNTITLSNISFGAGASLDSNVDTSNVTGTLDTTVSMSDTIFDSSLGILFDPGGTVSFLLDFTTNSDTGGTPDAFSFAMFDSNGSLIATADPTGADTIVNINLDESNTSSFVDPSFAAVTSAPVGTPEPTTSLLLVVGIACLLGLGIATDHFRSGSDDGWEGTPLL